MPSIPEFFEHTARRNPSKCAVQGAGIELEYDDLDRWAGQIAECLREGEVGGRVGVFLDHEPSAAAAILGVLKSGKTCVPMDYLRPADRLANLIADAELRVILSDDRGIARLKNVGGRDLRTIPVGEARGRDDRVSSGRDSTWSQPQDDAAFIVYTSGSTGRPKGVIRTHQSYYGLTSESSWFLKPTDRCLLLARCHTGQGVSILCQTVMSGATLCLWDLGVGPPLGDYVRSQKITVLWMTPSVFRAFMTAMDGQEGLPDVRVVRMDGETVRKTDFGTFKRFFREPCVFVNSLGTTETGCYARHAFASDAVVKEDVLPVGQPPPNVEVAIVDEAGAEVSPGDVGELVIATPWLSPGYLNQPEETRRRFRSLPDGRRAFFSGDLGMRNAAGQLVHLGRKDFQVKIWGYRVELEGIESQLTSHPSVREAVVTANADALGETRLVAYVTARDGAAPPTIEGLRGHLKATLPEYMVPSVFVVLEALPLTPNGKVDRKALPEPVSSMPGRRYVTPNTPDEELVAGVFRSVLGVERVGAEDDFFELGGHSLLATQVVARLRDAFDFDLPFAIIFEAPTVKSLAEEILTLQLGALDPETLARLLR